MNRRDDLVRLRNALAPFAAFAERYPDANPRIAMTPIHDSQVPVVMADYYRARDVYTRIEAIIAQEDAAPDMGNPITEMTPETGADQCEFLDWPSCPLVDCNCIEAREKRRADAAQDRGMEG